MKGILFKFFLVLIFPWSMSNECYATTALCQNACSETSAGNIDIGRKGEDAQNVQSLKGRKDLFKHIVPTRKQIITSIVLLSIGVVIFGGFGLIFLSLILDAGSTFGIVIVFAFIGLLMSFICLRGIVRRIKKLKKLKEEIAPNNLEG